MSAKKLDQKGRFRSDTIAFRISPAERKELDDRVKLCGFQSKQDFVLSSVLYQKVEAKGNPLMFTKFRVHLNKIYRELQRIQDISEVDEELFTPIRTMIEILESMEKKSNECVLTKDN